METYEVIIIGKGPSGISAALYTVRAGLKTLVIGSGSSALQKTDKIENYYGFENPISGRELLETGVKQAKRLGAVILDGEVTALEFDGSFTAKTVEGEYKAKVVLIATGQPPQRPNIPGVKQFEGKGVSYCTTCDGFFYKNKTVGVLGNGNYTVQEAMELEPFTKDITIYTNGQSVAFSGNYASTAVKYKINTKRVVSLTGGDVLGKIELDDSSEKLDGLFVASGTASSVDFAVKLGVMVKDSAIVADAEQKTNLPGIFAAGDCTGGFKQVSVAVGEGAVAGKNIIEYIRSKK
jgi:thioredoxin reductase (NADPH)